MFEIVNINFNIKKLLSVLIVFSLALILSLPAPVAEAKKRRRRSKVSRQRVYRAPTPIQAVIPREQLVSFALSLQGFPYRRAAFGPNAFDCSGFTMYCYRQVGLSLPHGSRAQFNLGPSVADSDLQPGDLVFFGPRRVSHVGMYVGDGNFIHAPRTGEVVRIQALNTRRDYRGARRIFDQ